MANMSVTAELELRIVPCLVPEDGARGLAAPPTKQGHCSHSIIRQSPPSATVTRTWVPMLTPLLELAV